MQSLTLFLLLTFLSIFSYAQLKATTETGRKAVLLENGKWYYTSDSLVQPSPGNTILRNDTTFSRDKHSSSLIKSKTLNIGIYLNSKEWRYKKPSKSEDGEYNFTQNGKGAVAAFLVTEKTEVPLESMADIALINAQKTDPQAEIIRKEYRTVNGAKVLFLQINVSISKIDFTLLGYYYTSGEGTAQLVTSTTSKLFEQEQDFMEKFLNGFVVL